MKKDVYFVIGSLALVVSLAIGAYLFVRPATDMASQSVEGAPPKIIRADQSLLVKNHSPSIGPVMARVVVVEYFDPECESCRAMHPMVKDILRDYEGRIRFVLRYMPYHFNSRLAAAALEGAGRQNRYWEMLDLLFEKQSEWGEKRSSQKDLILSYAKMLKLNSTMMLEALEDKKIQDQIAEDEADGKKAGVSGTPTFFVNGRRLDELGDKELRRLIDEEAAPNKNFAENEEAN